MLTLKATFPDGKVLEVNAADADAMVDAMPMALSELGIDAGDEELWGLGDILTFLEEFAVSFSIVGQAS